MTSDSALPRPRQVTTGVVLAIIGSGVLVISLFDTLGRLRSKETRVAIEEFLAEPPGNGLGIDTGQVVEAMRVVGMVSGALAAATLVFAVFVLQRHRGARVGLTVAAGLLLLTLPVAGLMPLFVAAGVFFVWSAPGRDWYAGRAPASRPSAASKQPSTGPAESTADQPDPGGTASSDPGPPPSPYPFGSGQPSGAAPSGQPPSDQPPSDHAPYGQPPYGQAPYGQPPYGQAPYGQPQYGHPPGEPLYGAPGDPGTGRDADRRPTAVTVAAILTWLGAGAVAAMMLVFVVVLAFGSDAFVEEFDRAAGDSNVSLSRDEVMAVGWAIAAVFLLWSLVAIVLAVLAFRRNNAARITLGVSAVMTALVSLLMILSIVSVITLLMAGVTGALLFTGRANRWYARRGPVPSYPQQPPSDRPQPW